MFLSSRLHRSLLLSGSAFLAAISPGLAAAQGGGGMSSMPGMQHAAPAPAMPGMMPVGPLGIELTRQGSGTSWIPEASPMRAYHWSKGKWSLMLHGDIDLVYDNQGTTRGDQQVFSNNWLMLMGARPIGSGLLEVRAMGSAEPFTLGGRGYPLLLQTGESFEGQPLKDRQHPHDLVMELGAAYSVPVSSGLAVSLYAAPVGEPAIGPAAFMHRPSAQNAPFATISHHWQDATHITFGVVTAGVYSRKVKVEGSLFNGREPDENRYDLDLRPLDSYSGRMSWNPGPNWSISTSYAFFKSPEAQEPDESSQRVNASVQHLSGIGRNGKLATALIYGGNKHLGEQQYSSSIVLEANAQLNERNGLFLRGEYVQKTAKDLVIAETAPET